MYHIDSYSGIFGEVYRLQSFVILAVASLLHNWMTSQLRRKATGEKGPATKPEPMT